ncbi:MAG: hypothetical protein WAT25_09645, partial [Paracoccaceae bacterium]
MTDLQGFFVAARHDTGDAVSGHYYQMASPDPMRPQVWGYTDRISYAAGETLRLHAMSQAAEIALRIERDGLHPECVHEATFPGGFAETPADCSVTGCGWPERYTLTLPESWKSGV